MKDIPNPDKTHVVIVQPFIGKTEEELCQTWEQHAKDAADRGWVVDGHPLIIKDKCEARIQILMEYLELTMHADCVLFVDGARDDEVARLLEFILHDREMGFAGKIIYEHEWCCAELSAPTNWAMVNKSLGALGVLIAGSSEEKVRDQLQSLGMTLNGLARESQWTLACMAGWYQHRTRTRAVSAPDEAVRPDGFGTYPHQCTDS